MTSAIVGQSFLLDQDVFIVDYVSTVREREAIPALKAICFLRPTKENAQFLQEELGQPRYGEYYLCMCPYPMMHSLYD
jgi:hypothetical protein